MPHLNTILEHQNIIFDEFVKLINNLRSPCNVTETNEILETIRLFDKQRKGFISVHDVELVVGQMGIGMTQNEGNYIFNIHILYDLKFKIFKKKNKFQLRKCLLK